MEPIDEEAGVLGDLEDVVAYLYACVGKRGRTTWVLNRRADDRGERGKRPRLAANKQGNTGTRPSDTEERADTDTEIRECMNILTKQQTANNNQQDSTKSVTTEQAGEQMSMPIR